MTTILAYHFELIIIALSIVIVIVAALLWHYRREIARLSQEIIRLRWVVAEQGDELAQKQELIDSQAEYIRQVRDALKLQLQLTGLQQEYIDRKEAELARQAIAFANLSVRYADEHYQAQDALQQLAMMQRQRVSVSVCEN